MLRLYKRMGKGVEWCWCAGRTLGHCWGKRELAGTSLLLYFSYVWMVSEIQNPFQRAMCLCRAGRSGEMVGSYWTLVSKTLNAAYRYAIQVLESGLRMKSTPDHRGVL